MRFNPRMMLTIFRKDLIDAIRDGRVAIALVIPILIGVSYSHLFDDETGPVTPSYTLAVAAADSSAVADQVAAIAGQGVDLTVETLPDEAAVREAVQDEDADLGLVVPAGFDAAVAAGEQPELTVLTPPSATAGTSYLLAALDPALRAVAGQGPPAQIALSATEAGQPSRFEQIGTRTFLLVFSLVFLVGMIAVFAIPIILTEEIEKKTLDALVMIASYTDVMIGKALVGLVYIVVASAVTLTLASASPGDMPVFIIGLAALSLALLGFGLFIGGLFRNANQLNTWGSLVLFPLLIPTFLTIVPGIVGDIATAFPTGAAARVLTDGLTGEALYGNVALYTGIMLAWAVGGFLLLGWQLRRRQA